MFQGYAGTSAPQELILQSTMEADYISDNISRYIYYEETLINYTTHS